MDLTSILDFRWSKKKTLPRARSDSGGFSYVHYLDAYKLIKGEWALLRIFSNLAHKNCFVYWTTTQLVPFYVLLRKTITVLHSQICFGPDDRRNNIIALNEHAAKIFTVALHKFLVRKNNW